MTAEPVILHEDHWFWHASGARLDTYEGSIWTAGDPSTVTLSGEDEDVASRVASIDFNLAQVRLRGLATEASWAHASLEHASTPTKTKYYFLKFDKPGHSRLRLTSSVPLDAHELEIELTHIRAARWPIRGTGHAFIRVHVSGTGFEIRGPAPLAVATTRFVIDRQALASQSHVEIAVEYLHGNTTHRIMSLVARWRTRDG